MSTPEALDNLDVPLRVLFEGTTAMTSLLAALDTEKARYKQLKEDNNILQAKNHSLEEIIQSHNSLILQSEEDYIQLQTKICQAEKTLEKLTKKVEEKQEIDKQLQDKLHHHQYGAASMKLNAVKLKRFAKRVVDEAEDIVEYAEALDMMKDNHDGELETYDEMSE